MIEINVYGGNVAVYPPENPHIVKSEPVKNERKVSSIRNSSALSTFKKKIRGRDTRCQCCGESEKILEVHHILPLSQYKDLACDENNAIVLCQSCHRKYHAEYKGEESAATFGNFMRRFGERII